MIDSAIVHAHQHAAGAKGGAGNGMHRALKRRIDDKNPYVVRCAGQATGFHLTPGHAHDLEGADRLLPHLLERIQAFLADKAYDAQERVLDLLAKAGVTPAIPPTSHRTQQRDYDQDLYQARPLIENFFAKLKHDRAIATRYDKRAHTFLGAIYLAASVIWLN
ncbi:MAG: Mobile element protein [Nitrospira sp.]|jgi:transposase|nr:Mobile element protein [Nitrospira sp.]